MQAAAIPSDEPRRLAALRRLQVLDTLPEPEFERVVGLARDLLRCPMAAVSLVDADRQWFKASRGFCTEQTPRSVAFCAHTILRNDVFVVPDAAADERFADNPLVTGAQQIRFYAAAPIRTPEGHPVGALCVSDTHPRGLTDDEASILRRLADIAADALHNRVLEAEAEAAGRATAALFASAAHELRTPLTAMLGFADLLGEEGLHLDQRREYVETIRRNGGELLAVINDLLDLARIQAGTLVTDQRAFPVADLVADVQRDVEPAAREKGLEFAVEVDSRAATTLYADPGRVRQVLTALAQHAIRLTQQGAVTLRVRAGGTAESMRFDITDTSGGASFAQASASLRDDRPGTPGEARRRAGPALGLRLARALTGVLEGRIEVGTAPGVGAVLSLTLPRFRAECAQAASDAPGPRAEPAAETPGLPASIDRPLAGARVLVVDDHVDSQRLMSVQLRRAGAIVAVAGSGGAAVDALTAFGAWPGEPGALPRFDAVLLSMRMGGMDGYAVARALRALNHPTPLLAVTTSATEEDALRCAALGCVGYLAKPFGPGVLVNSVRGLLARREAEPAAVVAAAA